MLRLPDGRVLVADCGNHRIRMLSADLQEVSTVAGDGEEEHQDGAAAQARFCSPSGLALLPDGRVLVADCGNARIRMLSADLQEVCTVAGDGEAGHQDGAAAQARFCWPQGLALLPDGRVLVADWGNRRLRMLRADLQEVSTLTIDGCCVGFAEPSGSFALLPDGRVLVAGVRRINVLEGLVAVMGFKPAAKPPKKTKRALAGGASASSSGAGSSGPALKRGRSGAGPSSAAAATSSNSDSDSEDGGSAAADAEPLV